jgi:TolB-like protein/DNA-binding winged helix-turn-helix (wHTH) protein
MTRRTSPEHDLTKGFSVGEWEIRPLAGTFRRGDHAVHVEPKVMDVLLCLARRQGEIVTRDELLDEVWNGVVVTDDVLTRCVSELRTLLGDTDRERRYIRTIPKRGYSLIPPVGETERNIGESPAPTAAAPGRREPVGARASINKGLALARGPLRLAGAMVFGLVAVLAVIAVGFDTLVDKFGVEVVVTDEGNDVNIIVTDEANVSEAVEPAAGTATGARPAAQDPLDSLAVLPFVNLSDQVEHAFFSDGLSEDIRNALITGTALRVAGRTSSRAFQDRAVDIREIGRQLNVDALLEGTVRIVGKHLRVTAQLTDASDGYPLWAASYDRELGDKMQSQVALAGQIVQALANELETPARPVTPSTANLAAHEFYLLGRHHWHQRTPESLQQAIAYFTRALALDSNYALAYSGLADAHLFQIAYAGRPVEEALAAGRDYAIRALELGPDLAEAHASMGIVYEHSWQLDRARQAYQRAVELQPRYSMAQMWLGNVWFAQEDVNRAHDHYSTALELDPLHPQVQYNYVNMTRRRLRWNDFGASARTNDSRR